MSLKKGDDTAEIEEEEKKERGGGDTLSPVTNITMKTKGEGRKERVVSHFDPFQF